jgi:hypothetical protein
LTDEGGVETACEGGGVVEAQVTNKKTAPEAQVNNSVQDKVLSLPEIRTQRKKCNLIKARKLLLEGWSIIEAARKLGLSSKTIRRELPDCLPPRGQTHELQGRYMGLLMGFEKNVRLHIRAFRHEDGTPEAIKEMERLKRDLQAISGQLPAARHPPSRLVSRSAVRYKAAEKAVITRVLNAEAARLAARKSGGKTGRPDLATTPDGTTPTRPYLRKLAEGVIDEAVTVEDFARAVGAYHSRKRDLTTELEALEVRE